MALSKITFEDKTALDSSPAVSEINKISDEDINEIKTVVNNGLSQVDTNTANIETLTNTLNTFISEIYKKVYPIGAHYITSSTENPNVLFPGTTWVQIKDTYIIAAGSTYKVGTTYGASSHTHTSAAHTHTIGSHSHTVNDKAAYTSGGPSNNTSGGPSNNTSGATTLTLSQVPSHSHTVNNHEHQQRTVGEDGNINPWVAGAISGSSAGVYTRQQVAWYNSGKAAVYTYGSSPGTNAQGGGGSHTHTLSSHTHSLQSHTHSIGAHNHGATSGVSLTTASTTPGNTGSASNLPPSIVRYVGERTA